MDNNENITSPVNPETDLEIPVIAKRGRQLSSIPIMLGLGFIGIIAMLILLISSFSTKKSNIGPTPTPLPIKNYATPTIGNISPTPRKISTDSAMQTILDAESTADADIAKSDFVEQKLIPPTLDMSITLNK